jgi:hypothetical protein
MRRRPGVTGQTSSAQVDGNVGPGEVVGVQLVWDVVAGVNPDLPQRFEDLRVRGGAGGAAG